MPLPFVANAFLTRLVWSASFAPDAANNVLCFKDDVGGSTPNGLFTSLNTNVTQAMWDVIPSTAAIATVSITPLDGTSASQDFNPTGTKWAGGSSGDAALQTAMVVTLKTAKRGRSYRGRVFLPYVSEATTTSGIISSAELAIVQTAWSNFITAMGSASWPLVVLSRKHSTIDVVTSVTARASVHTQRRRARR